MSGVQIAGAASFAIVAVVYAVLAGIEWFMIRPPDPTPPRRSYHDAKWLTRSSAAKDATVVAIFAFMCYAITDPDVPEWLMAATFFVGMSCMIVAGLFHLYVLHRMAS